MQQPAPDEIRYRRESRELLLRYTKKTFTLSAEFLRVNSPSAEVQGHGGEGGTLPRHKENVAITGIEPIGNYAIKITFSDGHDSGLYSWDWLHKLCTEKEALWQHYQEKTASTLDSSRGEGVVRFVPRQPS